MGKEMPKEDKIPVARKNGTAEEQPLFHDGIDKSVVSELGESVDESTHNRSAPSQNLSVQAPVVSRSRAPKERVRLDLEGLKKGKKETSTGSPAPDPPATSKKKGRRLAAIVPVLIVLLGGAAWFSYRSGKTQNKEGIQTDVSAQPVPPQDHSQPSTAIGVYHTYGLASFLVPIRTERTGTERFLKATPILAFRDIVPSEEISKKILMIRSKITDMLLGKSLSDLQSVKGKMAVKREIRDLLNATLTQGTVRHVYFEEFFIL